MKTFNISGVIGWDVTAQDVREFLRGAAGEPVKFVFSSPGGFVSVGLEIHNAIRDYPGETIAVLSGFAMSMASYIPMACDKILVEDNAVYMIHNARGGVWGDHNDILAYGAFVKGLSGLLSKRYCGRTGKAAADICEMMDKETYFFGSEIVEQGFADEVIDTGKGDDKESAVFTAQALYADVSAKLIADATAAREDIQKASALLNCAVQTPAPGAGKNEKEVQQMDLIALLAANPAAKVEYDAALAKARDEGVATVQARIDKVAPILGSGKYGATVTGLAVKVLQGTEEMAALTGAVTVLDAQAEAAATAAAATGTETPGQEGHQPPAADALIKDQAGLDAAIARTKGEV